MCARSLFLLVALYYLKRFKQHFIFICAPVIFVCVVDYIGTFVKSKG